MHVNITERATAQLLDVAQWWNDNRPDSRHDVIDGFEYVLERLETNPDSGAYALNAPGYRRMVIEGTPYYVYYRYRPDDDVLYVAAVWSTMRGSPPPL